VLPFHNGNMGNDIGDRSIGNSPSVISELVRLPNRLLSPKTILWGF